MDEPAALGVDVEPDVAGVVAVGAAGVAALAVAPVAVLPAAG